MKGDAHSGEVDEQDCNDDGKYETGGDGALHGIERMHIISAPVVDYSVRENFP
jgi:hypothetical protein